MRFTSRSPSFHVPAVAAVLTVSAVLTVLLHPSVRQVLEYGAATGCRDRAAGWAQCHIDSGNEPSPRGRWTCREPFDLHGAAAGPPGPFRGGGCAGRCVRGRGAA